MGRILKRVFAHQLVQKIDELLLSEVDVVLSNNSVLHGVILSSSNKTLLLRNIVRNKQLISFTEIVEIIYV